MRRTLKSTSRPLLAGRQSLPNNSSIPSTAEKSHRRLRTPVKLGPNLAYSSNELQVSDAASKHKLKWAR